MIENLIGETHRPGRIEVVCGSMFSGKTEELIRRLKRAKIARQQVMIFKPVIDTRYSDVQVVSHDHNSINSTPVKDPQAILKSAQGYDVIGMVKKSENIQFRHNGRMQSAPAIFRTSKKRRGRSKYLLSVEAEAVKDNQAIPVKLVFVKNRNNSQDYLILVSTDVNLSKKKSFKPTANAGT